MLATEEKRIELAARVGEEEIQEYVHDPSPRVLRALLMNTRITEEDVLIIANRKNVPSDILETIVRDKRWSESYPVRLALARNPRSPLTISLSVARFLRIFDLEEITRNHFVPLVLRNKVEMMISERIPTMPLGNKKTLARKAAGRILLKLLQDRIPEVVRLCLDNPHMIEAHLFNVINREDTIPETILMIAGHPLWSTRPLIRFSLARNSHTPLSVAARFLARMTILDLRELYTDPALPVAVKPLVHRELLDRGIDPDTAGQEQVFEITEEEMNRLESVEAMREDVERDYQEEQETPESSEDEKKNL